MILFLSEYSRFVQTGLEVYGGQLLDGHWLTAPINCHQLKKQREKTTLIHGLRISLPNRAYSVLCLHYFLLQSLSWGSTYLYGLFFHQSIFIKLPGPYYFIGSFKHALDLYLHKSYLNGNQFHLFHKKLKNNFFFNKISMKGNINMYRKDLLWSFPYLFFSFRFFYIVL